MSYSTLLHSGVAMMFATGLVFAASQQWPAPALLPAAAEPPPRLIVAPPVIDSKTIAFEIPKR